MLSISMCQSTWFMKLVSWLGRRGFWEFLNLTKHGKCLLKEVEDSVKLFYEDDEYSRLMLEAKYYVSTGRNLHQQRRLFLCNLKELC